MPTIDPFKQPTIESVSRILGDTQRGFTGSQIARLLSECGIDDVGPSTKWERICVALVERQRRDRCGNNVARFIQTAMEPVRHHDSPDWYEETRHALNRVLAFEGIELGDDGNLRPVARAQTLTQARARASSLRAALVSRNVHPDVLTFCREELLVDNHFHAVFEATKSVASKIRDRTGLTTDGAELIDDAFSFNGKVPHVALSSLTTESEKSEQKGFMNLLKGLFGTFRNPTAHEAKLRWAMPQEDALDILSLVSLVHRRIDGATTPKKDLGL